LDQSVQVERELGEAAQGVDQRVQVGGWSAANPAQDRGATQALDHLARLGLAQRRQPQSGVPEQLDEDAAQADQHRRAELRVVGRPEDERSEEHTSELQSLAYL